MGEERMREGKGEVRDDGRGRVGEREGKMSSQRNSISRALRRQTAAAIFQLHQLAGAAAALAAVAVDI